MRFFSPCVLAFLTTCAAGASASAQVVITSPQGGVFPAGPDYASDVIGDAWDFANPEDLSPDPDLIAGWTADAQARVQGTQLFVSGGRFVGTTRHGDPGLTLLARGGLDLINPGRTGLRFPISAARYNKFSARVSYTSDGAKAPMVYWFHRPDWHPQAANLADMGYKVLRARTEAGAQTLVEDLTTATGGVPWTGFEAAVRGLRFDPLAESGVGVQIDWVRLTVPDTDPAAALMSGRVNCVSGWQLQVVDADGITAVGGGIGDANWSFNYGIFPPGAYSLRLVCGGSTVNSVPFGIDAPPHVIVLSPTERGGEDFASSPHFANASTSGAWDMEQVADVAALANVSNVAQTPAIGGGVELSAVNTNGDPSVALLGESNNALPIPTARYRHLTFTLTVDGAYDLGNGSVARVLWSQSPWNNASLTTTTQDIKVFPGRHTYTIDLAGLSTAADPLAGTTLESGTPWASKGVWSLRIDPHEFDVPRGFHLDNVQLRATEEVPVGGGPFAIRYHIADPGAIDGQQTVYVFWDTDRLPDPEFLEGSSPKLIASKAAAVNVDDHVDWVPSGSMTPGEYFIFILVKAQATGQTRGTYSSGRVRVFQPASPPVIMFSQPTHGGALNSPFTIEGCATEGGGVDDVSVFAIGGPTVEIAAQRGIRFPLGLLPTQPGLGVQQEAFPCAGGSGTGFRVTGISDLSAGPWTLRVLARGSASGVFGIADVPFTVDQRSATATNLRVTGRAGNDISIAWDAPTSGRAVSAYRIEVSQSPAFSPLAAQVLVPATVTGGSGRLANGVWYIRVITESAYTNAGPSSNVITISLPDGPGAERPGAPVLRVVQGSSNPIGLSWSPSVGGSVLNYVLHAGTSPGGSELGAFPMGLTTSIQANAPLNVGIYVRVVAANVAGAAISNEVVFTVAGGRVPGTPSMNPPAVSGRQVTLSWTAAAAATSFTVLARAPGSAAVIATLPGVPGTTLSVPNVPPGTYLVSVIGVNGVGASAESSPISVVVR